MKEDKGIIDKYFVVAVEYQQAGNLPMAMSIYRQILLDQPNHAASIGNLAIVAKQLGNYDLAIKLLNKLIQLNPNDSNSYNTLGNVYYEIGNREIAIDYYKRAIKLDSAFISAYNNLGIAFQEIGDMDQAVSYLRNGLNYDSQSTSIIFSLANVYYQLADFNSAVRYYQEFIQLDPKHSKAYSNLALCFKALNKNDLAIQNLKQAIKMEPNSANAHYNLGNVYQELGQNRMAIEKYQRAIQINPNLSQVHINLAKILGDLQQHEKAVQYLKKAAQLSPNDADIHYNLGNLVSKTLDYRKSSRFYQIAIRLGSRQAIHNYLMDLNYVADLDPYFIFDEHQVNAKKLQTNLDFDSCQHSSVSIKTSKNQRIRVGYLSSDFREHSVSYFFQSIIKNHDNKKFETFCFYNSDVEDQVTRKIRNWSDHFISIHELSDFVAFQEIKKWDLNFLIELNGHTNGNRLSILRSGIADSVLSWIGYPNTTGLNSVDYKISDTYCDPRPSADQFYSEELIRFDRFFMVYEPPPILPTIKPSPYLNNHYLTFGSLNNFKKITPDMIHLWAEVLLNFPDSRMILKNSNQPSQKQKDVVLQSFKQSGLEEKRLEFIDRLDDHEDHLSVYNSIDVSLDTHPYSGTTTTFESLAMGVPVFTLVGQLHASRVTASILHQLGLSDFVVKNKKDYIFQLKSIVEDKNNFSRDYYRQHLLKSHLCDGPSFTKELEKKLDHIRSTE